MPELIVGRIGHKRNLPYKKYVTETPVPHARGALFNTADVSTKVMQRLVDAGRVVGPVGIVLMFGPTPVAALEPLTTYLTWKVVATVVCGAGVYMFSQGAEIAGHQVKAAASLVTNTVATIFKSAVELPHMLLITSMFYGVIAVQFVKYAKDIMLLPTSNDKTTKILRIAVIIFLIYWVDKLLTFGINTVESAIGIHHQQLQNAITYRQSLGNEQIAPPQ